MQTLTQHFVPITFCHRSAAIKRLTDLCVLLALLPLALPLALLVTCALLPCDGPVFFSQTRIGRNGKPFRMWKFRTMVPDAQVQLAHVLLARPGASAAWHRQRKLPDDPRITPLGRILRKTSLDELPQLWNVLKGEMSMVGPRPVPLEELNSQYGTGASAYLSCLPGMTGLWQVSGRNRLGYAERVRLDIRYSASRSFRLDLWILFKTVGTVLRGTGC